MSMDFNFEYEMINNISNEDFISRNRGVSDKYQSIHDAFINGDWRICCASAREENENLFRYLYDRLIGYKGRPPMLGAILKDYVFLSKVNDIEMIRSAENVQRIASRYLHKEQRSEESEEEYNARIALEEEALPFDTKEVLQNFSIVIAHAVNYINNNIPNVRGYVEITSKTTISSKTGKEISMLEADLKDVSDRRVFSYRWRIKGQNTVYREKTRSVFLQNWMLGKILVFEAVNDKTGQIISKEYGPIQESEIIGIKKPDIQEKTELKGTLEIELKGKELKARITSDWTGSLFFKWKDENGEVLFGGKDKKTCVIRGREDYLGKKIICVAYDGKLFTNSISNDKPFGPITEEMIGKLPEKKDLKPVIDVEQDSNVDVKSEVETSSKSRGIGKSVLSIQEEQQSNIDSDVTDNNSFQDQDIESIPKPKKDATSTIESKDETKASRDLGVEVLHKKVSGFDNYIPTHLSAPKFRCFDTNISRLHYFVAPRNDCYATNDFDYLDFNAYTYALLKDQDYQRVIIVGNISENEGDNYPIITYDSFSQYSFFNPNDFESFCKSEKVLDSKAFNIFCERYQTKASSKTNPIIAHRGGRKASDSTDKQIQRFGKRVVKTIIRESIGTQSSTTQSQDAKIPKDTFASLVINEINAALKNTYVKTAIVLPIEVLLVNNNLTDIVCRSLFANINNPSSNAIIITADKVESLYHLFENDVQNQFAKIDKAVDVAISSLQGSQEPEAYCKAFVDVLLSENRILVAKKTPGIDEVANYLFGIKLKNKDKFIDLPISKIYSLAEFIIERCNTSEKTRNNFPNINNNTWFVGSLRNLEIAMRDEEVIKALINLANSLWNKPSTEIEGLLPTSIERVNGTCDVLHDEKTNKRFFGLPLERYVITDGERKSINEKAQERLNELVGLENVKTKVRQRVKTAERNAKRNIHKSAPGHYIFKGHPGTGKTEVARIMGRILHAAGLLRSGHTVEVSKDEIVSNHIGESGKLTRKKCEEALDGVLFIDEAYLLVNTDSNHDGKFPDSFSEESYTTLLKFMEDYRTRICVIAAGYPEKMDMFRRANPGMMSRIPDSNVIDFEDYTEDELISILKQMAQEEGDVILSDEFIEEAKNTLADLKAEKGEDFGNARDVRDLLSFSIDNANDREEDFSKALVLKKEDVDVNRNIKNPEEAAKAWAKLDEFVGLNNIKDQLQDLITHKQIFGINKIESMIFAGPPGTGKTEVSKLIAPILKAEGVLKTSKYIGVTSDELQGKYLGETENKVRKLCEQALDGVLFIDEAYNLINPDGTFLNQYCSMAYNTIMNFMTAHKNHIIVIFAGYENLMDAFRKANPGMTRRVKVIHFLPFSDEELFEIFCLRAKESEKVGNRIKIVITDEFAQEIKKCFSVMRKIDGQDFGNAGSMQILLDACIGNAGKRFPKEKEWERGDSLTLEKSDIPKEYRTNCVIDEEIINDRKPSYNFHVLPRELFENLPEPYKTENVAERDFSQKYIIPAVAKIKTELGSATAFIIHPEGYAITCMHAIADKKDFSRIAYKNLDAFLCNGKDNQRIRKEFTIQNIRPDIDMALIKIETEKTLPYIKLAEEDSEVYPAEKCTLYGYPKDHENIMFDDGIVSTVAEPLPGDLGDVYYFSGNNVTFGYSGGPIISEKDGCAIGVLRGATGEDEKKMYNYFKPTYYFWKEFLK